MKQVMVFSSLFYLFIYLFIYLFMLTLSCSMYVGSSSLTRDRTLAPCIGSMESYALDHQESPFCSFFIVLFIFFLLSCKNSFYLGYSFFVMYMQVFYPTLWPFNFLLGVFGKAEVSDFDEV